LQLFTFDNTRIIKQFLSNTSRFIVCEATCFGPYMTIIRPSYKSSQEMLLHVGIPTMFTIKTGILCLANECMKFKNK